MAPIARYPTRPLLMWSKLKEIRRRLFHEAWQAREKGGVVVVGQTLSHTIPAGLGLWARRLYGPYFSQCMRDPGTLAAHHAAADARGFPRGEMCSSMHRCIGEMFLGLTTTNPLDGRHSPVDVIFEMEFCHSAAKTAQLAGELLGVPHFVLDMPHMRGDLAEHYVYNRMHEAVEFLERATGRVYRDDLLVEAVQNWWEVGALVARICVANRAVPATLDYQLLSALIVPAYLGAHRADVAQFYEELLAEVEDRVRDGISATGMETARLAYEGEPMYYAEDFIPKLVGRYGAVIASGWTAFALGLWHISWEQAWSPVPSWSDLGVTLKGRDDALRFLARAHLDHDGPYRLICIDDRAKEIVHRALDWRCDGVILHLDIGCRNVAAGMVRGRQALRDADIPAVTYQASSNDSRDFSADQVASSLESFLERLGLAPIA